MKELAINWADTMGFFNPQYFTEFSFKRNARGNVENSCNKFTHLYKIISYLSSFKIKLLIISSYLVNFIQ